MTWMLDTKNGPRRIEVADLPDLPDHLLFLMQADPDVRAELERRRAERDNDG